ncbi:hypothetical protein BUALT_Bualt07G0129200 [Buddleja alternifolia]|uniref:AtPDCT1/2 transmembrane domain-containing protein n=1 Tax=Buddleja alternifolia TaxID=168488 RepID=A0AAV6XES1_9LAMI|nr:hypothetical protein BUALT_Bualt07G0129200 [Buddleja alternifolia]
MNETTRRLRSPPNTNPTNGHSNGVTKIHTDSPKMTKKKPSTSSFLGNAHFLKWTAGDIFGVLRYHPLPCAFAASLLFFMAVEYTLSMIPATAAPFDLGFVATVTLHRLLAARPALNTLLAGLNTVCVLHVVNVYVYVYVYLSCGATLMRNINFNIWICLWICDKVFVGMQTSYILWTWLIEGRPRATISALFMFTFRGILGYVTQLPLPEEFLGSGADFPVGNVSFFLFYSGHVAASVIASLDMKRVQRWELAYTFDALNVLQVIRLLSTRGHYTIDLAVGVGAGILFDSLAGKYEDSKKREGTLSNGATNGALYNSSK